MEPQVFVRLSVGCLALRIQAEDTKARQTSIAAASPFLCEIRLPGFPIRRASVPLISTSEFTPDPQSYASIFYLQESDLESSNAPGCLRASRSHLEIAVYTGRWRAHCGFMNRRRKIGTVRVGVRRRWGEGKPTLVQNGWIRIGGNKQGAANLVPELHLRVKLEPDPRYIFQFEDETVSSPQVVQLQRNIKQPIFSCKFSQDRRACQMNLISNYCSSSGTKDNDGEQRERKGWKVMIHDLSGSAVAAAFMATPFVPTMGCNRVARSNPGAWLIVRPDPMGSSKSWHPWGRLEAWREAGPKDPVCLRFLVLPDGQEAGVLVSEIRIGSKRGGEFIVDMDRQMAGGDYTATMGGGGFVMSCKVQGEGKSSKPFVQLAMRHVTCVEDAAIFMALAAAVDLSIKACSLFKRRKAKNRDGSSAILSRILSRFPLISTVAR